MYTCTKVFTHVHMYLNLNFEIWECFELELVYASFNGQLPVGISVTLMILETWDLGTIIKRSHVTKKYALTYHIPVQGVFGAVNINFR